MSEVPSSSRAALALCIALALVVLTASDVHAGRPPSRWKARTEKAPGRLTLAARTSLSIINFSRPDRACGGFDFPPAALPDARSLRPAQSAPPSAFCPAASSDEVAVGFGFGLGFNIVGPLHLTWGFDVAYTAPQFQVLEPQTMFTMPFGVLLTWSKWSVRPIVEGVATPFVLVPDGVKSVMFGGRAGVAFRIEPIDLAFTVGYATADALRPWEVRVAVLHIP